jgi:hypothetical protein
VSGYWIKVWRKKEFLRRVMMELSGAAQLSLEGDLSRGRFPESMVIGKDETPVLKRSTVDPVLDFLRLSLEPETVEPIFDAIMALGLRKAIIHLQIERGGVLQLGAYDHFHPDCVISGPGISASFLSELRSAKVVREFEEKDDSEG